MNIKQKRVLKRVAKGSITVLILGMLFGVAGMPPAFSPVKANALVALQEERQATLLKYENSDQLTDQQLVELLGAVGFEGEDLKEAWAVAKKESHGNPLAHNGNRKTGDNSYGMFQINMLGELGAERRAKFGLKSNAELLNPVVNAKVAYHMSNGGKDWSSWKGLKTKVVNFWLSKFPHNSKAVAEANAKAKALAKAQAEAKAIAKAKAKAKAIAKAKKQ